MVTSVPVLIVEDEPELVRALSKHLLHRKISFQVARSMASAHALPHTFQVAVIDLHLPDGSGLDLQAQLNELARIGPTVFFSATDDLNEIHRAREAGLFIAKHAGAQHVIEQVILLLDELDGAQEEPPEQSGERYYLDAVPAIK